MNIHSIYMKDEQHEGALIFNKCTGGHGSTSEQLKQYPFHKHLLCVTVN